MKIIFFGTPQFAVPSLERLVSHPEFEVLGVVTQPDKRRGRGNQLTPSPVKTVALAHQLTVWQPKRVKKNTQTLTHLRQASADVFVVVAYGQILSQEILDMPKLGCVNVHGSILPKYRGAAPIQWCLYHGETETGITTMLMDAGMDTGAMLLKAYTPVQLLDNAHQLAQTLANSGADLLVETLLRLGRQEVQPVAQDESQATYAPLIQKPDYSLDWSRSAIELHNQVRGFIPNCVASFRDKPLKVIATVPPRFGLLLPVAPGFKSAGTGVVVSISEFGASRRSDEGCKGNRPDYSNRVGTVAVAGSATGWQTHSIWLGFCQWDAFRGGRGFR
jgi:methionyl-tRNA formyltransferase